jgi:hypothetical protein
VTKSFTAKAAKIAKEQKSLTAKAAKEGNNIFQKPSPKDAKTTPRVASG